MQLPTNIPAIVATTEITVNVRPVFGVDAERAASALADIAETFDAHSVTIHVNGPWIDVAGRVDQVATVIAAGQYEDWLPAD